MQWLELSPHNFNPCVIYQGTKDSMLDGYVVTGMLDGYVVTSMLDGYVVTSMLDGYVVTKMHRPVVLYITKNVNSRAI